ncbi:MAG: hypothetical protein ACTSXJ_09540 [Candidatus Baldrarchaeia archaeon]
MLTIRLKLRLKSLLGSGELNIIALVNSGYETAKPELLLPAKVAEELGLYPKMPRGAEVKEYILADGSRTKLVKIPDAIEVAVITEDRIGPTTKCDVVIAEKAEGALISDKLADALNIAAIAIGEGLWCFRDELGSKIRKSA